MQYKLLPLGGVMSQSSEFAQKKGELVQYNNLGSFKNLLFTN